MIKDSLENSMPNDFDSGRYVSIMEHLAPRQEQQPEQFSVFAGGWRGIAFRYLVCSLEDEEYTDIVAKNGVSPPWPTRFHIDNSLFNFFVNGLASIESFSYALFGIGALASAADFPTQTAANLKAITPKAARDKFLAKFPDDPITNELAQLINDAQYVEWGETRNVLAHRIAPGRILYGSVGGGAVPPDAWNLPTSIDLGPATTSTRRNWLASKLTTLIGETEAFCQAHL